MERRKKAKRVAATVAGLVAVISYCAWQGITRGLALAEEANQADQAAAREYPVDRSYYKTEAAYQDAVRMSRDATLNSTTTK